MLEDFKLLILIMAAVGFVFLVIDSIRRRMRRQHSTEKFNQTVFENTQGDLFSEMGEIDQQDPLFDIVKPVSTSQEKQTETKPFKADSSLEQVITIEINSRHGGGFSGRTLEAVLKSHGFIFGKHNIFHKHQQDELHHPVMFSLAQSKEPGIFDLTQLKHQRIPGIILFMVLPMTTQNASEVFELMLKSARQLAASLNGELCDANHNHLTSQTITHYRELIQENHRKQLAKRAE